eukprot:c17158_g1_i1.p1 GENE.c17158_g1_i1~~c17158_g1_i1.p1  ORF type:complete len:175 (+),score=32.45 c17158_g1_i1:40-564(+)
MGCNSSKSKDLVEAKRSLLQDPTAASSSTTPRTAPMTIGSPDARRLSGSGLQLSDSFTERRMKEAEFMNNVVVNTTSRFIDVSQAPTELDEAELRSRQKAYSKNLPSITLESRFLTRLPVASKTNARDVDKVLNEAFIPAQDINHIDQYAGELSAALKGFGLPNADLVVVVSLT